MAAGSKIYANAVAKYDEGKLLDAEKLKRITEASYFDALKMLYDYGYGEGLPIEDADAEKLTAVETDKLLNFVKEYSPDDRLTEYLTLSERYNNVKAAYKSRFVNIEKSAYFGGFDETVEAVKSGEYNGLNDVLANALSALDALAAEDKITSLDIDKKLTEAYYKESLILAKKLGKNARRYVEKKIDLTNMLTAFRCKKAGLTEKDFAEMTVDGGKLDPEQLAAFVTLDPEVALGRFDGEYYETAKRFVSSGDFAEFERESDELLYLSAVSDRENMTSNDPFIGYYYAKQAEIKTVRLVLTCLKNGATDEIKKRIRRIYE